jgi:hypothetical protein
MFKVWGVTVFVIFHLYVRPNDGVPVFETVSSLQVTVAVAVEF